MERKTIIYQWPGSKLRISLSDIVKNYHYDDEDISWKWIDTKSAYSRNVKDSWDIFIPVPGKDPRICRVGDYVIINPDGTYFQDLKYLQKYEK